VRGAAFWSSGIGNKKPGKGKGNRGVHFELKRDAGSEGVLLAKK